MYAKPSNPNPKSNNGDGTAENVPTQTTSDGGNAEATTSSDQTNLAKENLPQQPTGILPTLYGNFWILW